MAKKKRRHRSRTQNASPSGVKTAERVEQPTERDPHPAEAPARPARAEKKELARRQREQVRKRVRRAEFARRMVWVTAISGVLALAVYWVVRPDTPVERPDRLPGEIRTEAPWPANTERLGDRLDVLGLPPAGGAMHEHANVQIFVHGEKQTIPTDIGIAGSTHASIHTHETSGTIHLESQTITEFTLGQFFDVWGVRLTASCLGGYCNDGEDRLRVFVNGQEVTGSPRDLVVQDQDVVVVTYGTEDELPDPIPTSFDFGSVPQ